MNRIKTERCDDEIPKKMRVMMSMKVNQNQMIWPSRDDVNRHMQEVYPPAPAMQEHLLNKDPSVVLEDTSKMWGGSLFLTDRKHFELTVPLMINKGV
ncbi:hypothetical protein pdam_00004500 [Pocillopora damicornis]|uniref:Uncharacterized protein n=1 Tax=Pocillopora damicornis TaxID=46731 RepID=A0A3M6V2B4_POCDA|nr:hypothetical protein pdam_00004500 [Pocillopora damicornis]